MRHVVFPIFWRDLCSLMKIWWNKNLYIKKVRYRLKYVNKHNEEGYIKAFSYFGPWLILFWFSFLLFFTSKTSLCEHSRCNFISSWIGGITWFPGSKIFQKLSNQPTDILMHVWRFSTLSVWSFVSILLTLQIWCNLYINIKENTFIILWHFSI